MEEFLYFQRFDAKGLADFDDSIELHTGNSACQACSQGTVGNICGNGKLPQAYIMIKNQIPKLLFSGLCYLHVHHPFE